MRTKNNNQFATLNPATRGNLNFSFTQPLLRNRGVDSTRLNIQISKTNLQISDLELRNTVVTTVRNVKNAYWDLAVALSNLAVQQQTLESNANNLRTTLENTTAAESVIRDTDFASEIANFTKFQTQMQAGSTVLGNANQLTQLVAGLLR